MATGRNLSPPGHAALAVSFSTAINPAAMPMQRADTLEAIQRAFDPAPLETPAELDEFYVEDLNETRGDDKIQRVALGLSRATAEKRYKAFVMGHAGVGISTELSRLSIHPTVKPRFRTLRFSANRDLDPVNFKPFDVVLIIALRLAEETAKPVEEGGTGSPPADDLLRPLLDWFSVEKKTTKTSTDFTHTAGAGIAPGTLTLVTQFLGLSASLKTEAKRAAGRSKEVTEYRLQNINQLTDLANAIIADCNARLQTATGLEWLVIGDDFDKPGIPPERINDLFITYGNLLSDLRCHLILDLPILLGHSSRSNLLPPIFEGPHNFPDTPVYTASHEPHLEGRAALRHIIERRMDPDLAEPGQIDRLIVASGGNLRELFGLIIESATNAELRRVGASLITAADVNPAILALRKEYRDHLGENAFDVEKVKLDEKLAKLAAIYSGDPRASFADPTLYALLHARAVQEFNGKGWYGVHPLVVDLLSEVPGLPSLDASARAGDRLLGGTF